MIKKINCFFRVKRDGVFHDSRKDCAALSEVCNLLIVKVNELVTVVNQLESRERMLKEDK